MRPIRARLLLPPSVTRMDLSEGDKMPSLLGPWADRVKTGGGQGQPSTGTQHTCLPLQKLLSA